MSINWSLLAATVGLVTFAMTAPAMAAAASTTPLDAVFSTSYALGDGTFITWSTCGQESHSVGCTGGTISRLNGACSIMEGPAAISGKTIRRDIYVVEADSTVYPNAALDVYQHIQVVGGQNINAKIVFRRRFDLGLKAGLRTSCFMGANAQKLFVGTNLSKFGVAVDKTSYAISHFTNGTPAEPVSSIFSDGAGYVIVNFGSGINTSFTTFAPPGGTGGSEGGGTEFNLNENNAIQLR